MISSLRGTCKILPTLDFEDRIWWLLLSLRSRMGVKQATSSHSSEDAECPPWTSPLAGYWSFWQPGRGWNVGAALVWDNLRAVKPSWAHEQLQHCLPRVRNPECGACPGEDKTSSTALLKLSEPLWEPDTHRGSVHHCHNPLEQGQAAPGACTDDILQVKIPPVCWYLALVH